jgi:hypothetical protein
MDVLIVERDALVGAMLAATLDSEGIPAADPLRMSREEALPSAESWGRSRKVKRGDCAILHLDLEHGCTAIGVALDLLCPLRRIARRLGVDVDFPDDTVQRHGSRISPGRAGARVTRKSSGAYIVSTGGTSVVRPPQTAILVSASAGRLHTKGHGIRDGAGSSVLLPCATI